MKFYNIIYPLGLNSEMFNKCVKTFSSLNIKNENLNYENDYTLLYSFLNRQLDKRTIINERRE